MHFAGPGMAIVIYYGDKCNLSNQILVRTVVYSSRRGSGNYDLSLEGIDGERTLSLRVVKHKKKNIRFDGWFQLDDGSRVAISRVKGKGFLKGKCKTWNGGRVDKISWNWKTL